MHRFSAWILMVSFGSFGLKAQNYTAKQYGIQTAIKNVVYGTATNYLGAVDTLKLDIYKPSGNKDKLRPLLILNHGGAWIGGDKNDASIVQLAYEFTARGYVVASVNYRLGTHKANWAASPVPANVNVGFHVAYIADSAEVYRGLYRAVQDIKGAIRFMKGRHDLDSTCTNSVFIGGESAGGFNSLAVAYLNLDSEKPAACGSINDVPTPQSSLLDCYPRNKVTSAQLKRPDLGGVEGSLNQNGYNSSVVGVINCFGGLFSEALSNQWISGNENIDVYQFHQSCDGIVPCQTAICLSPLSINCNLGYTPFHTRYPLIMGSCALKNHFASGSGLVKNVKTEIFKCDDIVIPLTDCIRFAQNGSYHYLANPPQRVDTISKFLSPKVIEARNACLKAGVSSGLKFQSIQITPNPNHGSFKITGLQSSDFENIKIFDALGREVKFEVQGESEEFKLNDGCNTQFLYLIYKGTKGIETHKILLLP